MIIEIGLMLAGLFLILKGSEWLTDAAAPVAAHLNTTNVAVGLVLLSLLLSLPELLVALSALSKSHTDTAVGVSIGSIIINLGLIIGLSAVIRPLHIPRHVITRDAVFMLVITIVVALIVLEDLTVSSRDGMVFLLLIIPYLVSIYEQERELAIRERRKESKMIGRILENVGRIGGSDMFVKDYRIKFVAGTLILIVGAEVFTSQLIAITAIFGVPDLLIGLTIGALGTSIPNLAAALQAVKKGYDELAVSETIGSNIFTLLITLGVIAMFKPFTLDPITAVVTAPALVIVTGVFFIAALTGTISRFAGALLLIIYFGSVALEIILRTGG